MPVNTRNKRASCLALDMLLGRVWPNPDASLANAPDRAQMAYKYASVFAASPSEGQQRFHLHTRAMLGRRKGGP